MWRRWLIRSAWFGALACGLAAQPVMADAGPQPAPFVEGRMVQESAVRAGPGINFVIVARFAAAQPVTVIGCNNDCTWYQLSSGEWTPAFNVAPATQAMMQPGQQSGQTAQTPPTSYGPQSYSPPSYSPSSQPGYGVAPSAVGVERSEPERGLYVMAQSTEVRVGPGPQYAVSGQVAQGAPVMVNRHEGAWCELEGLGWAPSAAVQQRPATTYAELPSYTAPQQGMGTTGYGQASGQAPAQTGCEPSYPDFCLPVGAQVMSCGDIPYRSFRVVPPDPYGFDPNRNGIGCEPLSTSGAIGFDPTSQRR
jgi:uncharacterized protein YraI